MENKEQQETMLQIIKGHLERNEKSGTIEFKPMFNGNISLAKNPESPLTGYFMPQYQKGVDIYGKDKLISHER